MAVAQDLPAAREPRAVRSAPRTRSSSTATASEIATLTGNEDRDPHRIGRYLADPEAGRGRDRGPALLRAPRRGLHRHRARGRPGRPLQRRAQGGSTITQQFVKNALARPGQPHRAPEAARGGARLPARAPVVEGQDPHRVPELRSTSARAPTGSRRPPRPTSAGPTPAAARRATAAPPSCLPWEAALLAGIISSPDRVRPRDQSRDVARAPQPRAPEDGRAGHITSEEYRSSRRGSRCRSRRRSRPPEEDSKAPYFTSGCASSS